MFSTILKDSIIDKGRVLFSRVYFVNTALETFWKHTVCLLLDRVSERWVKVAKYHRRLGEHTFQ